MLETISLADPVLACEGAALHREQICPACRGELQAELLEAWYPRDFTLDACCEVNHPTAEAGGLKSASFESPG